MVMDRSEGPGKLSAPPTQSRSAVRKYLTPLFLAAFAVLLWVLHSRIHFDWATLVRELRHVSLIPIGIGCGSIYVCYWLRAWRWRVLLGHESKATALSLIPAQLIGFTMVALFGRVVDLARPWLIARRTETPVATQLAVYSIERAFDLAAAAILFSVTLAFAPHDMPNHQAFTRTGIVSSAATLFLASFAIGVRFFGETLAKLAARLLRPFSVEMAQTVAARILDFHQGMSVISSMKELCMALLLSLLMWAGIAIAYMESAHAFGDTPSLATLSVPSTMLLMAVAMGGSLFQLPVLGWFSQIAVIAVALNRFFGTPAETATACGAVNLFITTLCVVPVGLVVARLQGIGLRETARNSNAD